MFRLLDKVGLRAGTILSVLTEKNQAIRQTDDRTNILLLGIAGGDHDGPELTDTIMVFSFHKPTLSVSLLSLPRDIWLDSLKDKINSAYYYGEIKGNSGFSLAKMSTEEVVGIPLHYAVLVDFDGFKNVIDIIGGIDVFVQHAFTDELFPIPGKENDLCNGDLQFLCRYERVVFEQGLQHMNGEMALKYVRSRKAEGDEGTDFARGKRQQEVLFALKEKLLQPATWLPPLKGENLMFTIAHSFKTDLTSEEALVLGRNFIFRKSAGVYKIGLEEQFIHPSDTLYQGRYVLVPRNGFPELHSHIVSQLPR